MVQVGQSQTAHGGMLYDTVPGGPPESIGGKGGFNGFDGPSGSDIIAVVGFVACAESSGNVPVATGKHSVNADVM